MERSFLLFKLLKHLVYMDYYVLLAKIFDLLHIANAIVLQRTLSCVFHENGLIS